jgi:predicted trehalose synthase
MRPLLAHTDFDPSTDAVAQRQARFVRPPHAVEGALATADVVGELLLEAGASEAQIETLVRVVGTAIARHHSARARSSRSFRLVKEAQAAVAETIARDMEPRFSRAAQALLPALSDREAVDLLKQLLLDPARQTADADVWPLYEFTARMLRLADQAGTKAGAESTRGDREP